jgi:hypothetical protein
MGSWPSLIQAPAGYTELTAVSFKRWHFKNKNNLSDLTVSRSFQQPQFLGFLKGLMLKASGCFDMK